MEVLNLHFHLLASFSGLEAEDIALYCFVCFYHALYFCDVSTLDRLLLWMFLPKHCFLFPFLVRVLIAFHKQHYSAKALYNHASIIRRG